MKRSMLLYGSLTLAILGLLSCPPQQTTYGESLRILTFNVAMLEDMAFPWSSDTNEDRAARIATRIKQGDYDIVVLNEVFDEQARDKFVDKLSGKYPYYVSKVDSTLIGAFEDSGIMLFSRYPFVALPNHPLFPPTPPPVVAASSAGAPWSLEVGAVIFPYGAAGDAAGECYFPDCLASKGAALVRIENPETHRIINVAFTHLQASYGDGNCPSEVDARTKQFAHVRKLITNVLGSLVNQEDVFFLGDLNVNGDQLGWEGDPSMNWGYIYGGPCGNSLWEWVLRFDTPGTFFTDTLMDSWVVEQSPYAPAEAFDRGLSQGIPVRNERLDYVLRNRPSPPAFAHRPDLAVQHLTLETCTQVDAGEFLSDHVPVCANVNRKVPHCNPVDAFVPPMEAVVTDHIQYPGTLQWYRIDEQGTYLFAVQGTDIQYEVYEAKDLTNPIPQYFGETGDIQLATGLTIEGDKYYVPEAPFYIRVHHKKRTGTGSYTFIAHQMHGISKEDALVLRANDWHEYGFPPFQPLNQDDTMWFELPIEGPTFSAPQQLSFKVGNYHDLEDDLDLLLYADDGTTFIDKDSESEPDPHPPIQNAGTDLLLIERDDLGETAGKLYLKVKRRITDPKVFWIQWNTNLTILHGMNVGAPGSGPMMMRCVEETDAGIDDADEIYITVYADDKVLVNDVGLGQFDDESAPRTLEDVIPVTRFLNSIQIVFRESDSGAYGGDDHFYWNIGTLNPSSTESLCESACAVDEDAAGEYCISWNRSRTLLQAIP